MKMMSHLRHFYSKENGRALLLGWFSNSTGTSFDARKGLHVNSTSGAQFAVQPSVKPVVWFARAVVN